MYDNLGNPSGVPRPPVSTPQTPFGNPFYGASSGLIRGGLGAYGEKILGSSSEYVQSNVSNIKNSNFHYLIIFAFSILSNCKIFSQISRYFSDPQYYFQVNDHYVRNKLKVVLFPFLHRVSDSFVAYIITQSALIFIFFCCVCVTYIHFGGFICHFQGHWTRITEPVGGRLSYKPPIYDINAPDLYIPLMAFGTYVVLAGFSLGLQGK